MTRYRLSICLAPLLFGGCALGERGLVSPHQPVVSAAGATVPGCPNWVRINEGETEGQSSNYGCAAAQNLAAMIADPADLVRGRAASSSSAEVAVRAIKSYRDTQPSGKGGQVEKVSSKGGN